LLALLGARIGGYLVPSESTLLLYNSNSYTMDLFDELSEVTDSSDDGEEWDSQLDCDFEIDPDYVSNGDEYDPLGPVRICQDPTSGAGYHMT
jgi:hypothetical protein